MKKLLNLENFPRIELIKINYLNKATISSITNEFIDAEFIVETDQIVKTSGRSANIFKFNKNARIISIEFTT